MKEILKQRLAGGAALLGLLLLLWSFLSPVSVDDPSFSLPAPPAFAPVTLPPDFEGAVSPSPEGAAPSARQPASPALRAAGDAVSPAPQPASPAAGASGVTGRSETRAVPDNSAETGRAQKNTVSPPIRWRVRVGIYAHPKDMMQQLRTDGYSPAQEIWRLSGDQLLYAVYAGTGLSRWQAEELRQDTDSRYGVRSLVEQVESGTGR